MNRKPSASLLSDSHAVGKARVVTHGYTTLEPGKTTIQTTIGDR